MIYGSIQKIPIEEHRTFAISGATGEGVPQLINGMLQALDEVAEGAESET